jgi:hypothetical protein
MIEPEDCVAISPTDSEMAVPADATSTFISRSLTSLYVAEKRCKAHGSKFLGSEQMFQTEIAIVNAKAIFIDKVRECVEFWKDMHDDVMQIGDRKMADRCVRELLDCLFEVQGLEFQVAAAFTEPEYHRTVGNETPRMSMTGIIAWVAVVSGLVLFIATLHNVGGQSAGQDTCPVSFANSANFCQP